MKKSLAFAALATVLAAPAFGQTHVQSSTSGPVTSGTGLMVTPGAPSGSTQALPGAVSSGISSSTTTTTTTAPSATAPMAETSGSGSAGASASTSGMSGSGSAGATTSASGAGPMPGTITTTTTVTRHWVNVPPGVESDPSFQRWMRLR